MGPHSGRCVEEILDYKNKDITERGAPYTFGLNIHARLSRNMYAHCASADKLISIF